MAVPTTFRHIEQSSARCKRACRETYDLLDVRPADIECEDAEFDHPAQEQITFQQLNVIAALLDD